MTKSSTVSHIDPLSQSRVARAWPLWLFLLSLPATVNLFLYGLPINPDGPIHLLRIARLHEAIQQGIFFPRWMPSQLIGYGYPSLNYYASGSYYLVEALQLVGLPLYWAFVSVQCLLIFFAAAGMYLFARDLMGKQRFWPPLVAAIAYSYGPYFLHTLYVRGAIAEQSAQMLLPWILWGFRKIWRSDFPQHRVIAAALFLAALAFTHTISLLLVPPILLGYIAILSWDANQRWRRLGWTILALGGAMAISCFYWLPLILERQYLSPLAYSISQQRFLPYSFLEARNFLYSSLSYLYTKELDYRLTLVQVIGVVVGLPFVLLRWKEGPVKEGQSKEGQNKEWLYWVGVLLLCGVMMTKLVMPIWLSHEIFAIIQFPYRLLALFQIPVALLSALPFCYLQNRHLRAAASALAIAFLIWAYWPRLPWVQNMSPASSLFTMPMNAFFEVSIKQIVGGGEIVTSLQEFRPRWVSPTLELEPQTVEPGSASALVTPLAANPLQMRVQTTSPSPFPLRFNTFFFPGWEISLDGVTTLTAYPSTSLGLLSAEIPAGEHVVEVKWVGTRVAFWAALVSQLALLSFIVWQMMQPQRRRWGWALFPLLLVALIARYWQPPLQDVVAATTENQIPGVRLVGYGLPKVSKEGVMLYPYWYALETKPPELTVRWQLQDVDGKVVAQMETTPFYDAYSAENWPEGALIDDAQLLPLPANLPAASYQVVMKPLNAAGDTPLLALPMGTITLNAPTTQPLPPYPVDVVLGENIALKGYGLRVIERLFTKLTFLPQQPEVAIVDAGENLVYELYWQLRQETDEPYSGFVHLIDRQGKPLIQRDQSPGPIFAPVSIWGLGRFYQDSYMLTIPTVSASGLYWPQVGMYNWEDVERFEVKSADGETIGDHLTLPPVKIVNRNLRAEGMPVNMHFGEMGEMVRYQIQKPDGNVLTDASTDPFIVQAGNALTLTTYYHAQQPTSTAQTRFVQMRDATGQIAAQFDSEPQNGENPTWAWVKDEIVQDTILLPIPAETAPGDYNIYLGFYEPTGNFARLPVTNRQGERLLNDEVPLPRDSTPLVVQVVK